MIDAGALLGWLGTGVLVLAFILNVAKLITVSWTYTIMNLLGAGMAAVASYLIGFAPFVVLESVWFLAALAKLGHLYYSRDSRDQARERAETIAARG